MKNNTVWSLLILLLFTNCNSSSIPYKKTQFNINGFWLSHTSKAIYEFKNNSNQFSATIYSLKKPLNKNGTERLCTKCKGKLSNRPLSGLPFVRGLEYKNGKYEGGYILSPKSGKEYKVVITPVEQNKIELHVNVDIFGIYDKYFIWTRSKNSFPK